MHAAAQSICRQFRGGPDTSVCRAFFWEDCGVAVHEGTAAATAAHIAELLMAAAVESAVSAERKILKCTCTSYPTGSQFKQSCCIDPDLHAAATRALSEAAVAASRAEAAASSGYILWQPGIKVRRPKTGEEAISFGSAILIRAHTTDTLSTHADERASEVAHRLPYKRALGSITGGEPALKLCMHLSSGSVILKRSAFLGPL